MMGWDRMRWMRARERGMGGGGWRTGDMNRIYGTDLYGMETRGRRDEGCEYASMLTDLPRHNVVFVVYT